MSILANLRGLEIFKLKSKFAYLVTRYSNNKATVMELCSVAHGFSLLALVNTKQSNVISKKDILNFQTFIKIN